jgi:outer membrane lipoprotein SlyB
MNTPQDTPGFGDAPIRVGSSFSRPAAWIGGAVALVALTAIATTLVVKPAAPVAPPGGESGAATLAAQPLASPNKASGQVADEKPAPKAAPARTLAASNKAPATERVAAAPCTNCGVVESVVAVKQKGEASGVGAVGGAVVGGLLGSAVGKGDGRKVATVLGAVGGGVAGNEIEKNHKATTAYQVKVRMQDGSVRTVTQSTAPTMGQKVTLEGSQLKARA